MFPLPQDVDYFQLLGLDRRFDLDEKALTSSFRAVVRKVHPDRFCDQPEEVRNLATKLSADLNNAITTLKDPARRAAYLLHLAGGPCAKDERGVPDGVLMEVMELRERIEGANASGDLIALTGLRDEIAARREELLADMSKSADYLNEGSEKNRIALRLLINAVKYFDTLASEVATDPLMPASETDHDR